MKEIADPTLISEVRKYGVFNQSGCFNCGSCTLTCDLAAGSTSFPRKSMHSVVLGLKESVLQSLDPWLCHDCGDCSETCPREANPRESMASLRRYLIGQYDWTGFSRRICRSKAWEIGALSLAAVLMFALIVLYHVFIERVDVPTLRSTAMGFEHMFNRITYFTWGVFLIPAFFLVSHMVRMFLFTMYRGPHPPIPLKFYLAEIKTMLLQMITQKQILRCPATIQRRRWLMHWLLAFGCTLMFVVKIFFLKWFQTDKIYPVYHAQRWLGYLAFACIAVASIDILVTHWRNRELNYRQPTFADLVLPVLLGLTAVSGLAVHVFRYTGLGLTAHYCYAAHLMIAVPMLLVEIPFGKSSHMIYRPLALYFAAVRERAFESQRTEEDQVA
jgi:heterodisulfide reductase subunit C/quinone-modifying oxidoreductase subunit QmoC